MNDAFPVSVNNLKEVRQFIHTIIYILGLAIHSLSKSIKVERTFKAAYSVDSIPKKNLKRRILFILILRFS